MAKKIIVVGAGLGGLSAAALLAKDGFEVELFEKNEQVGGRAWVTKENGFTFDMGPSWYLMPEVFERFFAHFDAKPQDFYTLKKLTPSYRIFFSPKETIDISTDLNKMKQLFDTLEPGGGANLEKYLDATGKLYRLSMDKFITKPFLSWTEVLDKSVKDMDPRMLPTMIMPLDSYVKRFFKNPKVHKILEYTNVFLGGSPYNTPALYSILSYVDFCSGVFYPQGGVTQLPAAMAKLAQKHGATITLNASVEKILTQNGRATGVVINGKTHSADVVVVNADYAYAETKLLKKADQSYPQKYWDKKVIAPSAICLYLGFNRRIPKITHHNLMLEHDWQDHFKAIFSKPAWPEKPSYYVCAPSITDTTVAPEGCENIFALIPVASGLDDTSSIIEKYERMVIADLERFSGVALRDHLVVKKSFTQSGFAKRFNAIQGTALGLSHTLLQSAWWRPKLKSPSVDGLYYTGAYTHPGVGMPTCVLSGQIAAGLVAKDYA